MYCPNCGQLQASADARFCKNCGIALVGLSSWLAGSYNSALSPVASNADSLVLRRRRMRQGYKVMFLSAVLFPIAFALCVVGHTAGFLAIPAMVFLAGFSWMLYFRLFGEEQVPDLPSRAAIPLNGPRLETLSANQRDDLNLFNAKKQDTSEMLQPSSITERTTNLLKTER
jgi:hypothetical protein